MNICYHIFKFSYILNNKSGMCQVGTWNYRAITLKSMWLSNYYAVHLKLIQNNIEYQL